MEKSQTFLAFDLETTGFDKDQDRIIEVGLLKFNYNQDGEIKILDKYSQLINPQTSIPEIVKSITGIKDEDVTEQPTIDKIIPTLEEKFSEVDFVLGHNVKFDTEFLGKHMDINIPSIDSQFFAEIFFPGMPSYSLDVLPYELNIKRGNAHRAYDDALVCSLLLIKSLVQFVSLTTPTKKYILEIFNKADLLENEILEMANKVLNASKLKSFDKVSTKNPKLIKGFVEELKIHFANTKNEILFHPNIVTVGSSAQQAILELNKNNTVVVQEEDFENENFFKIKNPRYIICEKKLEDLKNLSSINSAVAILATKLKVSKELSNFESFPKTYFSEQNLLPYFWVSRDICEDHQCLAIKQIKAIADQDRFTISHKNFWDIPQEVLKKNPELIICDFDISLDALENKLSYRLTLNHLPQIMVAIKSFNLSSEIKDLIKSIESKNDIFWGIINIDFKNQLSEGQLDLNHQDINNHELKRTLASAQNLVADLEQLKQKLSQSQSSYQKSYSVFLEKLIDQWTIFVRINPSYHVYLEKYNEDIFIKLIPKNKTLKDILHSYLTEKYKILFSANQKSTEHYTRLAGLEDLKTVRLTSKLEKNIGAAIFTKANKLETTLKLVLETDGRSLIVAKNTEEAFIISEHLRQNLNKEIFSTTKSGSGIKKSIYNFRKSKNGVLVATAKSTLLKSQLPIIETAVITSIPFGPPVPNKGFMDFALPKAILNSKNLLKKIILSSDENLFIYWLDERLVSKSYGAAFVELLTDITNQKPQIINE